MNRATEWLHEHFWQRGYSASGVLVLHHVLQWHHLVSGIYPMDTLSGLQTNIFADGLFSIGMLIIMGIAGAITWVVRHRVPTRIDTQHDRDGSNSR